jgi:dihydroxyacetone kinase
MFELDHETEIGMGQHGEAGTGRMKLKTADEGRDYAPYAAGGPGRELR